MIIGLLGYSRSGKNAVGDILAEHAKFQTLAFADSLKRLCMRLFDWDEEQLWGNGKEEMDLRYPREHDWAPRPSDGAVVCRCCKRSSQTESHLGCFLTPRYGMQIMGTEGGRQCYSNIWVERALRDASIISRMGLVYDRRIGVIPDRQTHKRNVAITDLRFISETEALLKYGAKVYRIKRPGVGAPPHAHASETEQDRIPDDRLHGVINNDGTLEDLQKTVLSLFG